MQTINSLFSKSCKAQMPHWICCCQPLSSMQSWYVLSSFQRQHGCYHLVSSQPLHQNSVYVSAWEGFSHLNATTLSKFSLIWSGGILTGCLRKTIGCFERFSPWFYSLFSDWIKQIDDRLKCNQKLPFKSDNETINSQVHVHNGWNYAKIHSWEKTMRLT